MPEKKDARLRSEEPRAEKRDLPNFATRFSEVSGEAEPPGNRFPALLGRVEKSGMTVRAPWHNSLCRGEHCQSGTRTPAAEFREGQ